MFHLEQKEPLTPLMPALRRTALMHCRKQLREFEECFLLSADTALRTAEQIELGISHQTVGHGVQAGQPRLADTFAADRESSFMKAG